MSKQYNLENFESQVDYTTVLDNFEGPIDFLLFLINREQIEIEDIFVSKVTEQFLDYFHYLKSLPELDMDKASEYLVIAATIISIKAKKLVPAAMDYFVEYDPGYEEQEEAKEDLIQRLRERQLELFQEESVKLKERETVGYFYRKQDSSFPKVNVVYTDFTLDKLLKAYQNLMLQRENALKSHEGEVRAIVKEQFTVREKIDYIRDKIKNDNRLTFSDLFLVEASTNEIVTTFQALLELLKHQFIKVEQQESFDEIYITYNKNRKEDEEIGEIDEYN